MLNKCKNHFVGTPKSMKLSKLVSYLSVFPLVERRFSPCHETFSPTTTKMSPFEVFLTGVFIHSPHFFVPALAPIVNCTFFSLQVLSLRHLRAENSVHLGLASCQRERGLGEVHITLAPGRPTRRTSRRRQSISAARRATAL